MSDFASLGLSQPLVEAVAQLGFIEPTPIQSKAIPTLLEEETDFVGLAQTGTGKTAAFGLPLIDLVDASEKYTQALILAPTRELCLQITKELGQFGKYLKQLKIRAVYGGTDIYQQIKEVKRGAHIIVATPGRLRDMIKRKVVNIEEIEYVILDEADEMLNMGFKEEIDEILDNTPDDKMTWLFSATMPNDVRRIARNYMTEPVEMHVGQRNSSNEDIDHQYVVTRPAQRYEILRRFLDFNSDCFALVFTRTRRDSREVAEMLVRDDYKADALHGDLTQGQRDRVMSRFRSQKLQILVATDVAARGIDVNEISHVFHYNIPEDISFYTHRAGRTGRAGNKGISLVLAHPRDLGILKRLEKMSKIKFSRAHIPTGVEICEKRLVEQVENITETEVNPIVESLIPKLAERVEALSKEELLKKIATLSFSRFLKKYRKADDLNVPLPKEKRGRSRGRHSKRQRLFINVGTIDVNGKGGFLNFISRDGNVPGRVIGRIDMHDKFSFFEIEADYSEEVIRQLEGNSFNGRGIRINAGDQFDRKKKRRAHRN